MSFLSEEEVASFRNSGHFDEAWYVEQYPDVKLLGMDPARHFLWLGAKLGRRPSASPSGAPAMPANDRDGLDAIQADAAPARPRTRRVRATIEKFQGVNGTRNALRVLTPQLRSKIEESGFFDEDYYDNAYGELISDRDDLLADYIRASKNDPGRDPGPLFSTSYYLDTHKDVRDIHPFVHYVEYGMHEGRAAFSPEKVNAFLEGSADAELDSLLEIVPQGRPINVLHWDEGNFFFTDVARYLEQLLTEQGYEVTVGTDLPESRHDALNIVVAPHEFCALGPGRHWTADQYADAVYVNTEQWQTSWFALSLKYLRRTHRGVLDLNPSSAQGLAKLGMRTAFLPLLPLPGSCFDFSEKQPLSRHVTWHKFIEPLSYPDRLEERPYDVLCCGVLNDRRAKGLAAMAPVLARHRCFIHVPRFNRPIKQGEPDVLSAEDFGQIARNSKIMLNIHQGESHYIEWQRAFLVGMMQGAIVVSEPCYPNRFVRPGVHYVETSLERMGAVITELLTTQAGKEKMSEIHGNITDMRQRIVRGERFL
jgi:hypothetical protein